jgi:nitroimidazol reductase NimA-like FMN-containing flavoprotein (pyridoxamine 5'-phosphate oxidase superfamily)
MIGKLTNHQIDEVLSLNVLGRIGCVADGRIYVVPINYAYDGKNIIAHSVKGMKIDMMRKNPNVCFEVDEMKNYTNWKSVIAWGQYQELTEERDRQAAMKLFVDRTMRLKISETATLPEINENRTHPRSPGNIKPVIYRIVLVEKTGRYETD